MAAFSNDSVSNDNVLCRFCGRSVMARSVRCIHCMKELSSSMVSDQSIPQRMSLAVGVCFLLSAGAGFLGSHIEKRPSEPVSHAYSLKELDSKLNSDPAQESQEESQNTVGSTYDQELRGAIDEWTAAIHANPRNSNAYVERGWAYSSLQEYDHAVSDLSRAIVLSPKDSNAYAKRAWIYDTKGQYDSAVKDATRALKLDPHNTEAYEARANAYASLGQGESAAVDSAESDNIRLK